MRVQDIRRLIELVEQSQIDELEVRRWWSTVRIARTRSAAQGRGDVVALSPASSTSTPIPPAAAAEPGGHIPVAPAPAPAAGHGASAAVAVVAAAPPEGGGHVHQAGLVAVVSPMVGTFYAAPSPTAPPYVQVGARVAPGQVVCIIEAMKLMNEIEAEISGVIAEILVENHQPVEFNQPLFLVRPGG